MKDLSRAARKITAVLFVAQSLTSAGYIAAFTVNAIVGAELSGQLAWAGLPGAVLVLGGAFAALGWGYTIGRVGWRGGLALGQTIGVTGASVVGGAVILRSFPLFLVGLALMGTARAAADLGRFAAAEARLPHERGKAISNVVLGGTVGAVAGPLLVGPTGGWAEMLGFPELAGAYSVGLILFSITGLLVFVGLRPDPRDLGRELALRHPESVPHLGEARPISRIVRQPGVIVAMVSVVFAHMVMVMLMSITSLHMKGHHHALTTISAVITSHTFGMYAFSVVSGRLTDRWGRGPVILAGASVVMVSCVAATWSTDFLPLAFALFLLGLGWNFAYVGGSTLLADQLSPAERAKTQGFNDLLLGLASAAGSFGAGLVLAGSGYNAMALVGASFSLIPLGLAAWWQLHGRRLAVRRETS